MILALLPLIAAMGLTGCDKCSFDGYTPMRVFLVSDTANPPTLIRDGVNAKGCIVYTDIPVDAKEPDQYGEALRHIGQSIYQCLTNNVAVTVSAAPASSFYHEQLWFRIDGHCPVKDGFTYYGCFTMDCRKIDTELAHPGPPSLCTPGAPMSEWTADCWNQFYAVLGHEVAHGWLGEFHS